MLKLKVAAVSVNNLTDARYFAAYLVDWIGFDINPASDHYVDQAQLTEILGWVEGPKYLLQGVEWNEHSIQIVAEANGKIEAILIDQDNHSFPDLQVFSNTSGVAGDFQIFKTMSDFEKSEIDPEFAFIQFAGDISLVHKLLALSDPPGLLLMGSAEEAVGLKAFDELNEVFDLLYD